MLSNTSEHADDSRIIDPRLLSLTDVDPGSSLDGTASPAAWTTAQIADSLAQETCPDETGQVWNMGQQPLAAGVEPY